MSPACRASNAANPPASCQSMKGVAPKPQPRAAWPRGPHPSHLHPDTMGAFAPLEAFCRSVAGVSRLYWCNSPRLVAVRMRSGAVRSRSGAVRCPHRRLPRRQTPTMGRAVPGVVGEAVCIVDTTTPGRACRSHANPLLRVLACYFARKPAIPCLGGAAHARISRLACESEGPGSY